MKKVLIIALAILMMATMFVACSPAAEEAAPAAEEAAPAAEEAAPAEEAAAAEEGAQAAEASGEIPEGLEIAYYVSTLASPYHQADGGWGAQYAQEAYGANVTIMDGQADNQVMAENAELTLAGGYDMASWFVWEGDTIVQTVQDCIDGGMVSNTFYQGVGDIQMPFIYTVESEAAFEMGANAATKWKELYPDQPINYAIIGFLENPTVQKERTDPFIAGVLSVDPEANEAAMLDASAGTDAAYSATQDLLQSNPDVNIIYTQAADITIGVMAAMEEGGRGKAEDGVPLTEIICGTDAPEQEIKWVYDPTSSFKLTMSMTPKDIAMARIDTLMQIYTGELAQDEYVEIYTYDKLIDYWTVPAEEALEFFNEQYMGNLTLADLGM